MKEGDTDKGERKTSKWKKGKFKKDNERKIMEER